MRPFSNLHQSSNLKDNLNVDSLARLWPHGLTKGEAILMASAKVQAAARSHDVSMF